MSTGTNKERLTQNNGIITDNNADLTALKTKINNLPTSGDTTATANDIALGKTAVSKGVKITGTYTPPTVSLQSKDVTINQNGTTTIEADQGYDGLSDVDVTVSGILDTSDATATADDISQNKTAYVNGQKVKGNVMTMTYGHTYINSSSRITDKDDRIYIKWDRPMYDILFKDGSYVEIFTAKSDLAREIGATAEKIKKDEVICGVTGTYEGTSSPDWTLIGLDEAPLAVLEEFDYVKSIYDAWDSSRTSARGWLSENSQLKYVPLVDTSNVTTMEIAFKNDTNLLEIPAFNTSKVTNMRGLLTSCFKIKEFPLIDTSNVENMVGMFYNCYALTTIPLLNTSKVTDFGDIFHNCSSLSNESLNNVLAMCANATEYNRQGTNMTLQSIHISQTQAETCQTLSNWDAFVTAGWSTGYDS